MKKTRLLWLSLLICLSMLIGMTACSFKHPIEEFREKMEEEESCQMSVTMDVPLLGKVTIKTQLDGNIQYTPETMFSEEEYIETVGDKEYKYTKNENGTWTKTLNEDKDDSTDVTEDEEWEELLNPKNYKRVWGFKKVYEQKKDVSFENFDDVVITFEDDTVIIEMEMAMEGMSYDVKIEFSKIGEVDLTLPKVN